ncbi:MAG: hypothetical protein M0Q38_02575 [Bacteroidales bacterium]|jgi:class 3 adenylate cyclase|nr:hypothetical protein [Bacteroidales bacterium]
MIKIKYLNADDNEEHLESCRQIFDTAYKEFLCKYNNWLFDDRPFEVECISSEILEHYQDYFHMAIVDLNFDKGGLFDEYDEKESSFSESNRELSDEGFVINTFIHNKDFLQSTKVIFHSYHDDYKTITQCLRAGGFSYVVKQNGKDEELSDENKENLRLEILRALNQVEKDYYKQIIGNFPDPKLVAKFSNPFIVKRLHESVEVYKATLYCDISDSSEIINQLQRTVQFANKTGLFLSNMINKISYIIEKNEGHIENFIGDEVRAYFDNGNEDLALLTDERTVIKEYSLQQKIVICINAVNAAWELQKEFQTLLKECINDAKCQTLKIDLNKTKLRFYINFDRFHWTILGNNSIKRLAIVTQNALINSRLMSASKSNGGSIRHWLESGNIYVSESVKEIIDLQVPKIFEAKDELVIENVKNFEEREFKAYKIMKN